MDSQHTGLAADSVRRLRETLTKLHLGSDPARALQDVCDALAELLDCQLVVLTLVDEDGMRVVAYSGTADGAQIMGKLSDVDDWHRLLDTSTPWGELRFSRDPRPYLDKTILTEHDDPALMIGDRDHWGALNMLIAPLWSADGDLVGAISLDAEAGTPLPDAMMITILEMFSAQAGIAIYQQRLAERAAADHLALRLSEERYRLAFDSAPVGIAEVSEIEGTLVITRINRAAARMFGVNTFEVRDQPVDSVFAVVEGEQVSTELVTLLGQDSRTLRLELRFRRPDGTDFWGMVRAAPLPDIAGRAGILCQILDISESRAIAIELEQRARHDPLTGLPNRSVVLSRLQDVVRDAAETGQSGALLFCDLDNFKGINDEQGHLVGDEVLAELAERLGTVVRKDDTAGRFGGDEFVIVAYPLTLGAAKALGDRVSQALSEPMVFNGAVLRVGVSIGIALISGAVQPAEVLRRADAAMYAVRSRRHRPAFVVDTA